MRRLTAAAGSTLICGTMICLVNGCWWWLGPNCPSEPDDTWYAAPPSLSTQNLEAVGTDRVHAVAEANTAEAEALLAGTPAVSLDPATAFRLIGREVTAPEDTAPYLVRGLGEKGRPRTSANIDVAFGQGTLLVTFVTYGLCDYGVSTQRVPLVVFLPSAPQVVYVQVAAIP